MAKAKTKQKVKEVVHGGGVDGRVGLYHTYEEL
jgi:hypothetical protein